MFPQLAKFTDLSLLLLRLLVGLVFGTSGFNHLKHSKARAVSLGLSDNFTRFLGVAEVLGALGVVFGVSRTFSSHARHLWASNICYGHFVCFRAHFNSRGRVKGRSHLPTNIALFVLPRTLVPLGRLLKLARESNDLSPLLSRNPLHLMFETSRNIKLDNPCHDILQSPETNFTNWTMHAPCHSDPTANERYTPTLRHRSDKQRKSLYSLSLASCMR
jgi:DoxX-like family